MEGEARHPGASFLTDLEHCLDNNISCLKANHIFLKHRACIPPDQKSNKLFINVSYLFDFAGGLAWMARDIDERTLYKKYICIYIYKNLEHCYRMYMYVYVYVYV